MTHRHPLVIPDQFDAVLFDLDGVLTSTAAIHAACWKVLFDEFLRQRSAATGEPFRPFDAGSDYKLYVDGKPRYEGVRGFLEPRGIRLPFGDPGEPPGDWTVCGLGNRKDELVQEALGSGRVQAYEGSVAWVRWLRGRGLKTAVVSSSHNCAAVLRAAGIADLFDARVDGATAADLGLPGKPAPDVFLKAAELLGVLPARGVVVEDALSGVRAGRAGGFGLVIGVDREGTGAALRENGADVVVADLGDLLDGG